MPTLPPARTIFIGGIAVIGAVFGYLFLRMPDTKPPLGDADGPAPGALARPARAVAAPAAEPPGGKAAAPASKPAPKRQRVQGSPVDDLLDRWDALVAEFGEELTTASRVRPVPASSRGRMACHCSQVTSEL